ncbi:MAG TPA: hypothetical protein O0X42_03265 [Methanocorpusculum sp.]|nr:hypothetical protein [Methanocorpusculum sp.]
MTGKKDSLDKITVIDHPRMISGCIGLAMGLAVLVLSLLHKMAPEHAVIFLSIAAIAFGIYLLIPKKQ